MLREMLNSATRCLHKQHTQLRRLHTHISLSLPTRWTAWPLPHLHTTVTTSLSSWKHTLRDPVSYQEQLQWWEDDWAFSIQTTQASHTPNNRSDVSFEGSEQPRKQPCYYTAKPVTANTMSRHLYESNPTEAALRIRCNTQ